VIIDYQPKQQQLADSVWADGLGVPTILGYGGARGGGKSKAIRNIMLERRWQMPGTNGCIIRRVYDDIKQNHIETFAREFPELDDYYNVGDKEYVLPNKSRIKFLYAESAKEVTRKFWGPEYVDIFIDQAEQFSEQEIKTINTTKRWPAVKPGTCKMVLFFNPGGDDKVAPIGVEYLRRIFWLKQYKKPEESSDGAGEDPKDFAFIQAYGWDNYEWFRNQVPHTEEEFYELPNDQRFTLFITRTSEGIKMNGLPPAMRAGHLLGSFEAFVGQYFSGVWDEDKCVLTPREVVQMVQPWWTRWVSDDWGFAHAAVHLWWVTGKLKPSEYTRLFGGEIEREVDVIIVYREFIAQEMPEPDYAQRCADLTPVDEIPRIANSWLSPDAYAKKGAALTVAEQIRAVYNSNGLPTPQPANDERVLGWRALYNGLRQTASLRGQELVSAEAARISPMLFVSAECPQLIQAIPVLVRDPKRPEDVLKTDQVSDDLADSFRYGYMSHLNPRGIPVEVQRAEVYASAKDPNHLAMAMRLFEAKQQETSYVRARRRRR
jgi:phage terminase large subunit